MKANCVICGKEFEGRVNQKTCSLECRETKNRVYACEYRSAGTEKSAIASCITCGKEFQRRSLRVMTCGKRCSKERKRAKKTAGRREYSRLNRRNATCVICGKEFEKRGNAKTCGKECRKGLVNELKRKWKLANPEKCRELNRERRPANPEKVREKSRKWRLANPEKVREKKRRYWLKNHEKEKERQRRWRLANQEKMRRSDRNRRMANREKETERVREWRLANPERFRELQNKYERTKVGAKRLGIPMILYAVLKIKEKSRADASHPRS